jgi:hypothetical protein
MRISGDVRDLLPLGSPVQIKSAVCLGIERLIARHSNLEKVEVPARPGMSPDSYETFPERCVTEIKVADFC